MLKNALFDWDVCVWGFPDCFGLCIICSPGLITVAAFNSLLAYKHKLQTETSSWWQCCDLCFCGECGGGVAWGYALLWCLLPVSSNLILWRLLSPYLTLPLILQAINTGKSSRIPLWNKLECGGERKLAPHSYTDHKNLMRSFINTQGW